MITLGVILFFIVLRWDVYSDYNKWKNGVPVKHTKEAIIRGVYLIPSFLAFYLFKNPHGFWPILLTSIVTLGMIGFCWLLLFDGFYNIKRGFNWWFLGTIDKDESKLDNIQRKLPTIILKTIKILLPVIFILIYVLW